MGVRTSGLDAPRIVDMNASTPVSTGLRTGRAERGKKGACPMTVGLLSTIVAMFYGSTVSVLALTATFSGRRTLRREARRTLAVLVPSRTAGLRQTDRDTAGPND